MSAQTGTQWKFYAALEEIPDTVPEPQTLPSMITHPWAAVWRSFVNLFCQELLYEQQIDYAERCFQIDQSHASEANDSNQWNKLGKLMVDVITI